MSAPAFATDKGAADTAVPTLRFRALVKEFGATRALDQVDLDVMPGEIHGLLGQNGSGKSTLIKVLAGYHAPESGTLELGGETIELPATQERVRRAGVTFVHQDLALVPDLTAAENLFSGRLGTRHARFTSQRSIRRHARDVFARHGLTISPATDVRQLTPVERALLGVVRATEDLRDLRGSDDEQGCLLVLDEPTVFLPRSGIDQLFALVREHAARGAGVLFVSHDLDEVLEITDRVTVLRDGVVVGRSATGRLGREDLVSLIVGPAYSPRAQATSQRTTPVTATDGPAITVNGLAGAGCKAFDARLAPGEIVGLAGLPGSGFQDVPYLIFGARRGRGALTIGSRDLDIAKLDPHRACEVGIALVPGDRATDGGASDLTVHENLAARVLDCYRRFGPVLDLQRARRDSEALVRRFAVDPADSSRAFSSLSGGNQQKVLIAKWLRTEPLLLLLDEPTQGVDVGARAQIWDTIRAAARRDGCAVLCASTDHEQLVELCDRVIVMAGGRVVDDIRGGALTKGGIGWACLAAADMVGTDSNSKGAAA